VGLLLRRLPVITEKLGVYHRSTVTLRVWIVAHCPASGVKVKVVEPAVAVLMAAGFQVPVMGGYRLNSTAMPEPCCSDKATYGCEGRGDQVVITIVM